MAYTGKESKKVGHVRMCITDSLGYTEETNTTLEIDYTAITFFFKVKPKQRIPKKALGQVNSFF